MTDVRIYNQQLEVAVIGTLSDFRLYNQQLEVAVATNPDLIPPEQGSPASTNLW